ncbi:hypothetical protein H6G76_20070 [Nostoc sp. FACHB-152]|uniref:hypothetical protein n=1 Tax=Nostoc sp. FACHB-152 TaxID=2692837 RepID=UPI001686624B|nr:hypothetical protein [Nostoc sp. FACHB-152]MBD2449415.1 hypothetical protein [Nostoc sp. FACHB-152]
MKSQSLLPITLAQTPAEPSVLSVPSRVQEKIIEQVLIQSGGVGLGVLLSLIGAIYFAKILGVGNFISKCLEQVDSGTQSLKALTEVLNKITEDLKDNHTKYIQDHEDILEEISEVKEILKTDVMNQLKDIERKLTK